jgi:hypothetical protein
MRRACPFPLHHRQQRRLGWPVAARAGDGSKLRTYQWHQGGSRWPLLRHSGLCPPSQQAGPAVGWKAWRGPAATEPSQPAGRARGGVEGMAGARCDQGARRTAAAERQAPEGQEYEPGSYPHASAATCEPAGPAGAGARGRSPLTRRPEAGRTRPGGPGRPGDDGAAATCRRTPKDATLSPAAGRKVGLGTGRAPWRPGTPAPGQRGRHRVRRRGRRTRSRQRVLGHHRFETGRRPCDSVRESGRRGWARAVWPSPARPEPRAHPRPGREGTRTINGSPVTAQRGAIAAAPGEGSRPERQEAACSALRPAFRCAGA